MACQQADQPCDLMTKTRFRITHTLICRPSLAITNDRDCVCGVLEKRKKVELRVRVRVSISNKCTHANFTHTHTRCRLRERARVSGLHGASVKALKAAPPPQPTPRSRSLTCITLATLTGSLWGFESASAPPLSLPVVHRLNLLENMKVADHVWYVTGAASGLGEATARKLHDLGGYVAIWDINEEAAEALAKELGQDRAISARVDVISEEDVVEAIQKADKAWPKVVVGGVVNCGGVAMAGKVGRIDEISAAKG